MEVNQERAKRLIYSQCWSVKLITSFLKILVLRVSRGAQGNFSSIHRLGQHPRAPWPSLRWRSETF